MEEVRKGGGKLDAQCNGGCEGNGKKIVKDVFEGSLLRLN